MSRLDDLAYRDPDYRKSSYDDRLAAAQDRLLRLRLQAGGLIEPYELGPPLCVLLEGWDASGKGGAIRRLVEPLDPRHVRVAQFAAPSADDKRHHFLWRFWPTLPGWGGMAVLDRSWYGRVLVERVEGFATEPEWRRSFKEIRDFESMLTADGMVLVKLWMHISDAEQLERFERRERLPLKRWKLTDEDWRNRAKRAEYELAVTEMIDETSAERARWTVIDGNSKKWARIATVEAVADALERGLAEQDPRVPASTKR
jgi:AMP-polyphosphate phosphotransferase